MSNSEWSLLFFTLFAQTAVGGYLFWQLPRLTGKGSIFLKNKIEAKPYLIITILSGIALLISFFHLGTPSHALYSLSNLKTSWLSREILFASLFAGLVFLNIMLVWQKIQGKIINTLLSFLTVLSGVALVYSMAKLYMLPTIPSWNSPTTMIEFFTTSLLLGLFVATCLGKKHNAQLAAIYLFTILPIVLLVKLTSLLFISIGISDTGNSFLMLLLSARASFLLLGIILIFVWLLKKRILDSFFTGNLFYIVLFLFFLSEITGRYLFYAHFISVGI
jgi:anaerobic dimethyl sulfoxide reductase subunit C